MRAKTDEILNIPAEEIERTTDPERLPFSLDDFPKDQKGNAIVPDDIFSQYYKQLPNGTRNETGNRIAYNGGMLSCLAAGTDETKAIQAAGNEALRSKYIQRRTIADEINIMLTQKVRPDIAEALDIPANADNLTALVASVFREGLSGGNSKAWQFVRDTVGEMPTIKQEVTADILTAEDRELLQKIRDRQQADKRKTDQKTAEDSKQE